MSPGMDKLSLLRLAEMKRGGEKIAMVTAYDAPSARLADEAGVDLILVGDSAAMVVLGHDSTLPVTLDEMLLLTIGRVAERPSRAGRRRSALRLVPGVRREGRRQRRADGEGSGRRHREARRLRSAAVSRPRHRGRRDPGDGSHRPDPAIRDAARRLQTARQDRRQSAPSARRREGARSRELLRPRHRSGTAASCDSRHPVGGHPRDRHRRRPRDAMARCSCGTTCSASPRIRCRAS